MSRPQLALAVSVSILILLSCGERTTIPVTGTIYGDLVLQNGEPASGIEVIVEGTGLSTFSDAEGQFIIQNVLAVDETGMGKYYDLRGQGDHAGTPIGFIVEHFKIKGQQSYSIGQVVVPPTGMIAGSLSLEGVQDHSGVHVSLEGTSLETVTRANGSYFVERVPAHDGYVILCTMSGYVDMTIEEMELDGEEVSISVNSGETTDLGPDVLILKP